MRKSQCSSLFAVLCSSKITQDSIHHTGSAAAPPIHSTKMAAASTSSASVPNYTSNSNRPLSPITLPSPPHEPPSPLVSPFLPFTNLLCAHKLCNNKGGLHAQTVPHLQYRQRRRYRLIHIGRLLWVGRRGSGAQVQFQRSWHDAMRCGRGYVHTCIPLSQYTSIPTPYSLCFV